MFSQLNKKSILIALSLFILVSCGGFVYYKVVYLPAQIPNEPEIRTASVRQGDLVIYASGSGTLIAGDKIELGFGINGSVAELYVQAGDEVQVSDVLAVQGDREQLEAAVAAGQLAVMNAKQVLDDLYENADVVTAQAQLDLANAMDELHTAQTTWTVQQEGNRASEASLEAAEAELEMAEGAVERAKQNLDRDPDNAALQLNYANAQKKYNTALLNWNWYTGHPTEIQQAQLDAEVAVAEALVAEIERAYEQVKNGPDPDEVAMAELQLASVEAELAVSQRNLEESIIVAPMDGTILAVTADVGQSVSGSFITLADLSQLYLEIYLDETDLDKIDLEYEVDVIFDALPDEVYTGQVIQVDPSLYTSGGVSTIRGWIKLDESSLAGLDSLLIGMNAAVDVIGGRAEGVTLVPVEALRELAPGEYAVFVMEDGEPKLRMVEVGLMDYTFVEITSGLEIGEVVTTGIVEVE